MIVTQFEYCLSKRMCLGYIRSGSIGLITSFGSNVESLTKLNIVTLPFSEIIRGHTGWVNTPLDSGYLPWIERLHAPPTVQLVEAT